METYKRFHRGLQENLDLHGENHISNVVFYDKLANCQYSMNDFDEALSFLEKSYELQLSILGESNESVLDTDYKIGLLMSKSSKGYSSQYITRHMKRLLVSRIALDESTSNKIKLSFAAPTDIEYLDLMDSSMIYCDEAERQIDAGNFSEAEQFYKRCLKIRLVKFGPFHVALSMVQRKFASLLLEMGKIHDASVLLEECLTVDSKHFGRQSERVADHLFALSHIYKIRERIGEALAFAQEALQIRRTLLGEGHQLVIQTARVVTDLQVEADSATSRNVHRPQGVHHAQHLHLQIDTPSHISSSNQQQQGYPAPPETADSNDIFSTSMSPLQPITGPAVPSHPLATAGSETEDMLCEEIAIDRMYAKLIDDHAAQKRRTGQRSSNNADEGDGDGDLQHLQTLCSQLGESDGPEDDQLVEKQVLRKIDTLLFRIHGKILSVDDNDSSIHLVLDKVLGIVNMYSTPRLLMYVKYAVNRAHAMAYFKVYNFAMAMKFINPAISGCPQANGYFVGGLADALVLLTGCHSSLGRRDDALHSARLAVNIAHERLEGYNKTHQILTTENPYVLGPTLDPLSAVILTYCTLASELEKSGLGHLSIEWYERAVQAAVKFKMDASVVVELTKLIDLSRFHLPLASPPSKQKRESGFRTHRSDSENTVSSRPTNNSKDARHRKRQSEEKMRYSDTETDGEEEYRFHDPALRALREKAKAPTVEVVPEVNSIDTRERGTSRVQRPQSHHQAALQSNLQQERELPVPTTTSRTRPHSAMPRLVKYNYSDNGSIEEMHHPYYNNNYARQQETDPSRPPQQYSDYGYPPQENPSDDKYGPPPQQAQTQQRQTYQTVNQDYFQHDAPLVRPQNNKAQGRRTSFDNRIRTMPPVSPIGNSSTNHAYNDTLSVDSEGEQHSQHGGVGQGGAIIIGAAGERVRPKSAVSKLGGGYMSPAVAKVTQSNTEPHYQAASQKTQHNYSNQHDDNLPKYSIADMSRPPPPIPATQMPKPQPLVFNQAIILLPSSASTLSSTEGPRKKQPSSSKVKSRLVNSLSNLQRPVGSVSPEKARRAVTAAVAQPQFENENIDNNRHPVAVDKKVVTSRPTTATQQPLRSAKLGSSTGSIRPKSSNGLRSSAQVVNTALLSATAVVAPAKPSPLLAVSEFSQQKVAQISQTFFPYIKGMQIEAKYLSARLQGSRTRWYPGRIVSANFAQGLYDVEFENGEKESDVHVDDIRIPESVNKRFRPLKSSTTLGASLKKSTNKEETGSPPPAGVIDFDAPTAKSIRTANMQLMHETILRTFSGVTSREAKRKIARLEYKNAQIAKIQCLMRGMSVRLRLPKIRSQILRERDLKTKERALQDKEQLIMESYQQLMTKTAMSQMSGTGNDSPPNASATGVHQQHLMEEEEEDPFESSGTDNLFNPPQASQSAVMTRGNNNNTNNQIVDVQSDSMAETPPHVRKAAQAEAQEARDRYRESQDMVFLKEELLSLQREQTRLFELETRRQADMEGKYNLIFEELLLSRKELKRNRRNDNERRNAMESQLLKMQAQQQSVQAAQSSDIFDENGNVKIDDFWAATTDFEGSSDMFSMSVMSPLPTPSHRGGKQHALNPKEGLYISVDSITPMRGPMDTSPLGSTTLSVRSEKRDAQTYQPLVKAKPTNVVSQPVVVSKPVVVVAPAAAIPKKPVVECYPLMEVKPAVQPPVAVHQPVEVSIPVIVTPSIERQLEKAAITEIDPVVVTPPPEVPFSDRSLVEEAEEVDCGSENPAAVRRLERYMSSTRFDEEELRDLQSEIDSGVPVTEKPLVELAPKTEPVVFVTPVPIVPQHIPLVVPTKEPAPVPEPKVVPVPKPIPAAAIIPELSVKPIVMETSLVVTPPIPHNTSHVIDNDNPDLSHHIALNYAQHEGGVQDMQTATFGTILQGYVDHTIDNTSEPLSHYIGVDFNESARDGVGNIAVDFHTIMQKYEDHTIENSSEPLSHFIAVNYNESARDGESNIGVDFHTVMNGYVDQTIENTSEPLSHIIEVNYDESARDGVGNIGVDFRTVMQSYEDHTIENRSEPLTHFIGVNFSECAQHGVENIAVDFHTMLRESEEEDGDDMGNKEGEEKEEKEKQSAVDNSTHRAVENYTQHMVQESIQHVVDQQVTIHDGGLADLALGGEEEEEEAEAGDKFSPPHTPINIVELHTSAELYEELEHAIASLPLSTPCALTISSTDTQLVTIHVGEVEIRPTDIFEKEGSRRSVYLLPDLVESVDEAGRKTYKTVKVNLKKTRSSDASIVSSVSRSSRPYELLLTHDSLRSLFRTGTWAKLRDGSSSPMRKSQDVDQHVDCLIRASQIKVHVVLKLFIHLWESYVNWTIQGILIQAAITELVCDNVKQLVIHPNEDSPGRRPWQTYFVDLLQAGRELFLTYTTQVNRAQQQLGDELINWEFDTRRKTDTARWADDKACPESMLIANMNTIAHSVRDKLTDVSIDLGLIENRLPSHELKMSPRGNIHHGSTRAAAVALNRQQIRRGSSRRFMNEQLNLSITPTSDDVDAMWSDCYEHIADSIKTLLHSLNLMGEFTAETDDCLQTACRLVFTVGLNQMREFHWRRWWQGRNECIELISQEALDAIVIRSEELMFAAEDGKQHGLGDFAPLADMITSAVQSVPPLLADKYLNRHNSDSIKSSDSSVVQQECQIS